MDYSTNASTLDDTFDCPLDGIYDLRDTPAYIASLYLYKEADMFLIKVVLPIISTVGFLGNVAFLFSVIRVAEMRNTLSIYLVNLTFADIMTLICINYWYAIEGKVNIAYDVESVWGCVMLSMSLNTWYFASLFLVTLISLERYLAVCKPFKAMMLEGAKRNMKILLGIWLIAIAISISLIVHYGKFRQYCILWPDDEQFQDLPDTIARCHPLNKVSDLYQSVVSALTLLLTMIVNSGFYVKIIYALGHRKVGDNAAAARIRNQVARTLVINGVLFFLCHLPFAIMCHLPPLTDFEHVNIGYLFLNRHQKAILLLVGKALLLVNSVINPYVYVLSCEHYRYCMIKAFWLTARNYRKPIPREHRITTVF